ncbi:SH3 domain-containing protein [Streptomyces angustmyceticus]|uniref:SH3 domain-containing protein n=1 Tax=Streptomyces angustmyceticus TaxID=285578 RepID=UPI003806C0A0
MNRRMMRNGVVAVVAALAMVPAVASADSCPHPAHGRHFGYQDTATMVTTARTTHAYGRVVTPNDARLNVRSGPGTGYRVVGTVRAGRVRALACKTYGSPVGGNERWYRLSHHRGYVSAHYVQPFRAVPWCRVLGG